MATQYSKEWYKERMHLFQAAAEGKEIKNIHTDNKLERPEFYGSPDEYEIIEPKSKWLITGWVKSKMGMCKLHIEGHDSNAEEYYIEGEWLNEEEMKKTFSPCESPIGN